jgi:hypothetical protein
MVASNKACRKLFSGFITDNTEVTEPNFFRCFYGLPKIVTGPSTQIFIEPPLPTRHPTPGLTSCCDTVSSFKSCFCIIIAVDVSYSLEVGTPTIITFILNTDRDRRVHDCDDVTCKRPGTGVARFCCSTEPAIKALKLRSAVVMGSHNCARHPRVFVTTRHDKNPPRVRARVVVMAGCNPRFILTRAQRD